MQTSTCTRHIFLHCFTATSGAQRFFLSFIFFPELAFFSHLMPCFVFPRLALRCLVCVNRILCYIFRRSSNKQIYKHSKQTEWRCLSASARFRHLRARINKHLESNAHTHTHMHAHTYTASGTISSGMAHANANANIVIRNTMCNATRMVLCLCLRVFVCGAWERDWLVGVYVCVLCTCFVCNMFIIPRFRWCLLCLRWSFPGWLQSKSKPMNTGE